MSKEGWQELSATGAGRACRVSSKGAHSETGRPLATSAELTQNTPTWGGMKIPGDIRGS